MEIFLLPSESLFLEFQLSNGSGWLTSHRLILCEHPRGQLEGHTPVYYPLKDLQGTQLKGSALTVQFKGREKAKIILPLDSPSLLEEIKEYIEKAALNHQVNNQR
jgi:hypothetical protein